VFHHFLWPTFLLFLCHLFFFSSRRSEYWRSFNPTQVPIIQDLQLPAQGSGLAKKFLSNSCSKFVIQLNICHAIFWCPSMPWHPILFIMQIKTCLLPFSVGFISNIWLVRSSSTWGTIFHIKQCNSILEKSFNTFLCSLCFSKLPWSFFFLFWCGLTIILRLLSSVTSNSVLSFQMSKFLSKSFATPYA